MKRAQVAGVSTDTDKWVGVRVGEIAISAIWGRAAVAPDFVRSCDCDVPIRSWAPPNRAAMFSISRKPWFQGVGEGVGGHGGNPC
jgi:hypothetical protein